MECFPGQDGPTVLFCTSFLWCKPEAKGGQGNSQLRAVVTLFHSLWTVEKVSGPEG